MSWVPKQPLHNFFTLFWGAYYILKGGLISGVKNCLEMKTQKRRYVHVYIFFREKSEQLGLMML